MYVYMYRYDMFITWKRGISIAMLDCSQGKCITFVSQLTKKNPVHSLKLTFSLKMDGWNTTFLLGFGLFSGAFWLVLGRVSNSRHQRIEVFLRKCAESSGKMHQVEQ